MIPSGIEPATFRFVARHFNHCTADVPNIIQFFFPVALRPNAVHGLLNLEVSRSHTAMHHSRLDSSGRVIGPTQRPLPDNTQHSQQTDIHVPGGIRTRNPSKRAAADPRLRPCGPWDRPAPVIRPY